MKTDGISVEKRFDLAAAVVLVVALGFAALVAAVTVAILTQPRLWPNSRLLRGMRPT